MTTSVEHTARTSATGIDESSKPDVLLLSLVHPDLLPSVHALSLVLRDRGFAPTVVSFASPVPGRYIAGHGVRLIDCGPHAGSLRERMGQRAGFRSLAERMFESMAPIALIATCPFSYLEALRLADVSTPVVYMVQEIHTFGSADLRRSPVSSLRNWRAERRLDEATLLVAPSPERAGFIAARAGLERIPATVLNCPYLGQTTTEPDDAALDALIPERFSDGVLVVSTGRVSDTQAIHELVESVRHWPEDANLAVTGVDDSQYSRRIREARDASPRRDDICLLPMLPRAAMLALQRRARVGICLLRNTREPAAKMPAPNKVGEYLRWGALIVAPRLPFLDTLPAHGVAELAERLEPVEIGRAVTVAVGRARHPGTQETVQRVSREWYNMGVQAAPILEVLHRAALARAIPRPAGT